MYEELIQQLKKHAVELPEKFSKNAELLDALTKAADALKNFRDCRNELCLKCGEYKRKHLGACDGCRWRADND